MHKLNYERVIEEALNKSKKSIDDIRLEAVDKIKETMLLYNPKGLSKEDKNWYKNILGLIDYKAGVLMRSKDNKDFKIGISILEIKTDYILPTVENYIKMYEMKEFASK